MRWNTQQSAALAVIVAGKQVVLLWLGISVREEKKQPMLSGRAMGDDDIWAS